ncbi:MAG: ABC transporter permease, partial [Catenulispora sp.]|nr:ABC transporter permease [Catenulispora sp.]
VGLVALALSVPFVVWSLIEGGVDVLNAVVTLGVVALLIGVICALAQALSALVSRSISSGLLSYLVTAALTLGTLITYFLALSVTADRKEVQYTPDFRGTQTVHHSEDVWWLLSPNPFVVLADAAPALPPLRDEEGRVVARSDDPLGDIRRSVRDATLPEQVGPCDGESVMLDGTVVGNPPCRDSDREPPPVWPWGLGFDLLLGCGAVVVTVRRLRTPATRLGRGVRVA